MLVLMVGALLLTTGCQTLFSSHHSATQSKWTNWDQVTISFRHIIPNHTTTRDLKLMGFDPSVSPNIKILPYVDVIPLFMPNPNIRYHDLPIGVQVYFDAKQNTTAYLVELEDVQEKRHGNLFLDIFGFKRLTHQSGWRFKGLILLKNHVVIYTLASGEPDISRDEASIKPLGPLQDLSDAALNAVSAAK